jgi:hypothetical protein
MSTTSVDFGVLRPQWLSVTLFVLLPLAYALLASWLCERLASDGSRFQRLPVPALVPVGIIALTLPETMILGAVVALTALAVTSVPVLLAVWRTRAVTALGATLLVALVAFGLFSLAWGIASIVAGRGLDPPPTPVDGPLAPPVTRR